MHPQHSRGEGSSVMGLRGNCKHVALLSSGVLLCSSSAAPAGPSFDYAKARVALQRLQKRPAHSLAGDLTGEAACMPDSMLYLQLLHKHAKLLVTQARCLEGHQLRCPAPPSRTLALRLKRGPAVRAGVRASSTDISLRPCIPSWLDTCTVWGLVQVAVVLNQGFRSARRCGGRSCAGGRSPRSAE